MRSLFHKVLLGVVTVQLVLVPAFAADNTTMNPGFSRPLNGSNAGTSFRKRAMMPQQSSEDMVQPSGTMMQEMMGGNQSSMSGLMYQVHILGEVQYPGTYRIMASDRLSEVLNRAGGVADQGSERNIEVRREGEKTRRVDLLGFQINGSLDDNPYLLDNDVIFVPLKKSTIQVVGAINRPREYEIRNEKTLKDAIILAGGRTVGTAVDSPIRVVRFTNNQKKVIEIAQNDADESSFLLENGDVIFVPHMITEKNKFDFDIPKLPGDNIFYPSFEDRVFILGGVVSPGPYNFNPYYSLPQYLSLAGGTSKLATGKINVLSPDGKNTKITKRNMNKIVINPGDTIVIGESRIPPEGWISLFMSIASFGLSTTATVLALTR